MYGIFRRMMRHRGVTATEVADKLGLCRNVMWHNFKTSSEFNEIYRLADAVGYRVAFVPKESLEELPGGSYFYKEYKETVICDVIVDEDGVIIEDEGVIVDEVE